jgi:hypothetical protein
LRQAWDLRCKVYVAKFSASDAKVYLSRISHTDITGFTLNVDQALPDGTAIDWEYSVDSAALNAVGKVWRPFVPLVPVEVPPLADGSVADVLDLRATLRTTSLYVSPGFHRRNLSVHVTTNKTTALYVSKSKLLTADADAIAGQVDILDAPGGSKHLYASIDDGAHWREVTLTAAAADGGGVLVDGFTRYAYLYGTSIATPTPWPDEVVKRRLRLRLEITTTNKALRPRARALGAYAVPV